MGDLECHGGPPLRDYAISIIPYEYNGVIQNVSYGIYAIPPVSSDYPYFGNLDPNNNFQFGVNGLAPLCDNQGANAWDLSESQYSCVQYDLSDSKHSIQEYVEKYVETDIVKCANFSQLDLDYNIETKDVKATILFGDEDVHATAEFDIILKHSGESITKIEKFSKIIKIRFKRIYELAYFLIEEENSNLFFNMSNEETLQNLQRCPNKDKIHFTEKCLKPDMSVKLINEPCKTNSMCTQSENSDIIFIQDNKSLIKKTPFVFMFGVKNRGPAIDYIDESIDPSANYYFYLKTNYGVYPSDIYYLASTNQPDSFFNIAVDAGKTITVYPRAVDPDGDDIIYNYLGWKTPTPIADQNGTKYKDILSGKSDSTVYGGGSQNKWEMSTMYSRTKKDATLKTNASDSGYHWIRIEISDGQYSDYQDIAILTE